MRVRLAAPRFDLEIYREPELAALGRVMRDASERHGRPIILFSDESYDRIVFDGIDFRSPALDYDASITRVRRRASRPSHGPGWWTTFD